MSGLIICPNCQHKFEATDAFRDEVQRELNAKAKEWQLKKEEEYKLREQEFAQKAEAEKKQLEQQLQQSIQRKMAEEYNNQLKQIQQDLADNQEKLKLSRQKELEYLDKEKALAEKEAQLEINAKRKALEEREKIKEQLAEENKANLQLKETEYQLQMREMQKQLEDQKRLVDEMKRKQEQGSMQLQGEVQEILLEELLQKTFPFDAITEVGKGIKGADCIQTIHNKFGQSIGSIIYESKRTKEFSADWIDKLKADMRSLGADVAVIVTQTLPKDMDRFGEKDGVYICTFSEVRSVALLLRNALLKIHDARKSQENKGDKMVMLYDYLTGNEFTEQWAAIREGFHAMKQSIQKEREAMERLWKTREKQLEKVLLNASHIKGSIIGIAGNDAVNLNLLEEGDEMLD